MDIQTIWANWAGAGQFSGVFSARDENGVLFEACRGHRHRAEALPNRRDTAFGIASGTKLFTGLAVCRLVAAGRLSLEDKLWDVLPYDLGQIDKDVTVFHLLTHTSGVGDYIDEEAPGSDEQMRALYARWPVYLWESLSYYLPMITPLPPKFAPGARFGYSNAGFVLLGLAVEAAAGLPYQHFVTDEIIRPLGLAHTGFYRSDALPPNTALGYTGDAATGALRTNIFSLPVLGGSDGGLYTCADDLHTLWRALLAGQILPQNTLQAFLRPQVQRGGGKSYGLGVYRCDRNEQTAHYAVGGDFGVDFFTVHFPALGITVSALGNTELDTSPLLNALLDGLLT